MMHMRSSILKVAAITIAIVFSLQAALWLIQAHTGDDSGQADAAMKEEKDSYGYMWVDSNDPTPKTRYEWIEARGAGTKVSISGDDSYTTVPFPFQFPYYGRYYDRGYPNTNGLLGLTGQYYHYYNYDIPTSNPSGSIFVYWDDLSIVYSGEIWYIDGTNEYGVDYICIEWYQVDCPLYGSDQITFEVILYEDGMIKMQYYEVTATSSGQGSSATVGLQSHDSTVGCKYSYNQAVIYNGLAIMFGNQIAEMAGVEFETDEGGVLYAQHRYYSVSAKVKHPFDNDLMKQTSVTFGADLADAVCNFNPDGTYYFSAFDPNGYLNVDTVNSYVTEDEQGYMNVHFLVCPTFSYPTNGFQNLAVSTAAVGVMPGSQEIPDAYWVETQLDTAGSLYAYNDARGFIENGGWVGGNAEFYFRGVRAVYPGTALSPMSGSIQFTVTDELGNPWVQDYVDGDINLRVQAENDYVTKLYNVSISGVPPGTDISEIQPYQLRIDPFRPNPPVEIMIHADSYEDKNTEFDDDNEVYVTWEPAEDFESGIMGYYVTTYDPLAETTDDLPPPIWVESPDTSTKVEFEGAGARKVWVWAVDRAGNPSIPDFAITKIDNREVNFAEFSPGNQIWVNTHTPVCSVLVSDGDGSGVSAKDLQYSISTSTINEYSAWQSAKIPRDSPEIRLSVSTNLVNGKTNWIKFRGKDVAGNGWTESQDFNVWVDEEPPSFTNFRPYESEYQNGATVVVSLDLTDIHGSREGSGVKLEAIEFRYTTAGKGLYGDWAPLEATSVNPTYTHIEVEIDFDEGTDNYIQFRAYDNVGNYATSKEFNIKVNSAPVVEAFLSEPKNGVSYLSTEKILFDASGTVDIDGDDLTYSWYSDINRFLSSSPSFFRSLSPGVHSITLVVNDPAHSVVKQFEITVYEEDQIDPMSIDSDGDGIYDDWEIMYKLNPYRPDSFLDSDNDMFTNFQEYQNGTDPTRRSSHPPYPEVIQPEGDDDDGVDEQYQAVTLAIVLISVIVIAALLILAFSRRRNFRMEVEDEKQIEADELDYRSSMERKRN
ncbi:MAG: hypothetical protein ACMUIE_07405 [Thermoplasmatota archaeon]